MDRDISRRVGGSRSFRSEEIALQSLTFFLYGPPTNAVRPAWFHSAQAQGFLLEGLTARFAEARRAALPLLSASASPVRGKMLKGYCRRHTRSQMQLGRSRCRAYRRQHTL